MEKDGEAAVFAMSSDSWPGAVGRRPGWHPASTASTPVPLRRCPHVPRGALYCPFSRRRLCCVLSRAVARSPSREGIVSSTCLWKGYPATQGCSRVCLSRRSRATSPWCGSTQCMPLDSGMAQVCPACRCSVIPPWAASYLLPGKVLCGDPGGAEDEQGGKHFPKRRRCCLVCKHTLGDVAAPPGHPEVLAEPLSLASSIQHPVTWMPSSTLPVSTWYQSYQSFLQGHLAVG